MSNNKGKGHYDNEEKGQVEEETNQGVRLVGICAQTSSEEFCF